MNKYKKMDVEKVAAKKYSSADLEVIGLYDEVIEHLLAFCNDLGAKNVSDIFNIFSILAHEGYLSYNKEMTPGSRGEFDIFPYEGADLLIGKGNCLNFSNFLKRLYEKRNNDAYVLANYLYGVKDSNFNEFNRLIQKIGRFNHACCFVLEGDVPYIFDSLNVEAFVYNNNKVQYGNHGGRLRVNLDKTYLLNDITMEQFEGVKNSPSCYRTILQEKRNIIEKNAGKVDANIYKMLDQTDCMDDFYNTISPCLAKAKKLQKH